MGFSPEEIKEFCQEATELLQEAEENLLALDKGGDFGPRYDAVFRAFHSTKGGAGMMELTALQSHMHQLESLFVKFKGASGMPQEHVDFFLRGIDVARALMNGEEITFNYEVTGTCSLPKPTVPSAAKKETPPLAPTKRCPRRLLDQAIELIMYQWPDLEVYLEREGKGHVKQVLSSEIQRLIKDRSQL